MLRIVMFAALAYWVGCTDDPSPSPTTTPIRSAAELRQYLKTAHNSPLDCLAPDAKQRFLDSLVFGDRELGGFRYTDLQTLPTDDVYRILSLFGAERTVPMVLHANPNALGPRLPREPGGEDHENYYCQSPHNCVTTTGVICMTGC